MSLISTRRALLLLCVVCASVVAGILLWNRAHIQPKITDRWLLREAVKEWKREGVPYPGPSYQIFEQQAGQGYYEDAMTTAHQLYSPDDIRWAVVELAKIRTENGDLQGAKDALKNVSGSNLGNEALKEIAAVQARRGDIEGALATVADIGDADEVLLVFARRQLHNGDFDGALRNAEKMNIKSADQVFYDVGNELQVRGEQKQVHELAARMADRKLAALFIQLSHVTLYYHGELRTFQATPCDTAAFKATEQQFAEAIALVDRNHCRYVSLIAVRQYPTDPVGAERLLRSGSDPQDLVSGLGEFVEMAAATGNIQEALRFLNELENFSKNKSGASGAVHAVSRAWTIRDGPQTVLVWVRSRPTTEERTWGLIGMAEAFGHARPQ